MGAIIGMAQDFVGSNNINILKPNGQFGCLAPDTPILMWNNTIKLADEIVIGDELVGDDGNKRVVLKTTSGIDKMYKINIKSGNNLIKDSFVCNSQHILTLNFQDNNKIIYDGLTKIYYFEYYDGKYINKVSSKIESILIEKQKEIKYIYNISQIIDIKLEYYLKLSDNLKSKLEIFYNLTCINWDDKYKRLQILADFIDTSGYIQNNCYEIIQSINNINNIDTIAKSLGYSTYTLENQHTNEIKIIIMGTNLEEIPCKKFKIIDKCLLTNHYCKFDVEYVGNDKFNGWQVNENERFLLGNFIVTHNSRLHMGKDYASPRYIWTKLEDITTIIFNSEDHPVLKNQTEDNEPIEPEYYVPIIPMILVNGTQGIGTGFATKIPCYNPVDIINNLKNKLISNEEFKEMSPWWNKFDGTITKINDSNYEINGIYKIEGNNLIITELPVGESTFSYKEFLEKLLEVEKSKKKNSFLGYTENNTDTKIYFELEFESGFLQSNINNVEKLFHLVKKYAITNMHLFDANGTIKKYNSPVEIMNEYYKIRLEYYNKRKEYQLNILKHQLEMINNKVRFILMIINKEIIVNNKKKSDIEEDLIKHKFTKIDDGYNYLLSMPIYNLTKEKIEELKLNKDKKEEQYKILLGLTIEQIWLDELSKLEKELINIMTKEVVKDNKPTKINKKSIKKLSK
jgi:hypothetical protein